uniref:Activating transcription factor 1 n=1 Tax=Mus musculus TaxID=10090 RepID=E9Q356_MOUSE
MEDSHKSNTTETASQPGSTVAGPHVSQIVHQLPLPQTEPYSWPVQARMECRHCRH